MPDNPAASGDDAVHASLGRRGRILRRMVIGAVVLLGLVVVSGAILWFDATADIEQESIPAVGDRVTARLPGSPPVASPSNPAELSRTLNVLAVGTDSREGLTEQQLLALGTERVEGERADTVILMHVSPDRARPVLVAFPRDLRVDIPERGTAKLNASFAYGGPQLLVRTVESFTGIAIDHYAQVDIAGFLELVDIVGGVPVCLQQPLVDRRAGADLEAGRQVLRGPEAAAYVRARHAGGGGDLARVERQQGFLRQTMRKALSVGTLVNPVRLKRVVDAAAGALVTDDGFATSTMARIAWSLRDVEPGTVDMRTVPTETRRLDGTSYQVADTDRARALFEAIRTGAALPAPSEVTSESATPAGNVPTAAALPSPRSSPRPGECT